MTEPAHGRWLQCTCLLIMLLLAAQQSGAQMVELYAGHWRAGVDLMWFKNFKDDAGKPAPWLFFSRHRASVNYSNQPLWGSTNAVSYNFKSGVGTVAVAALGSNGFTSKLGVQYNKQHGNWLFFGWLVADVRKRGGIDLFGLWRYQPALNERWKALLQVELFPVYQPAARWWNLTQRLRLGAKYRSWSGGWMVDLNQTGSKHLAATSNIGAFMRHDF